MPKCDCGAKHTSHKNLHSDWCEVIRLTNKTTIQNFGRMEFKRLDGSKIKITIKDGGVHIADMDYRFRGGEFKPGVVTMTIQGQDFKAAVQQCVDYLQDCINDDRIDSWIRYRYEAEKEWKEENEKQTNSEEDTGTAV